MRCFLALLIILAAATQGRAQYDEKMGSPGYPYKTYKEFIPAVIARLADTSILGRRCGPGPTDELVQKGYRFFDLCIYAQDHYNTYLRQSEEDGGGYSVVAKDRTLSGPERAAAMRDWLLKKNNGMPVTYAAYTRQEGPYDIEHFLVPLALKSSRDEEARPFLNYGISISLSPSFDRGLIAYHIYPLNRAEDLTPDKDTRGFPDYIAMLQCILGSHTDHFARIRSRSMKDGRYSICLHSPDVVNTTMRIEDGSVSVLLVMQQVKGKNAARFAEMAGAMKAAKWPAPFTAAMDETPTYKTCHFTAKDASGKAVHPLTFSLKLNKEQDILFVTVRSAAA